MSFMLHFSCFWRIASEAHNQRDNQLKPKAYWLKTCCRFSLGCSTAVLLYKYRPLSQWTLLLGSLEGAELLPCRNTLPASPGPLLPEGVASWSACACLKLPRIQPRVPAAALAGPTLHCLFHGPGFTAHHMYLNIPLPWPKQFPCLPALAWSSTTPLTHTAFLCVLSAFLMNMHKRTRSGKQANKFRRGQVLPWEVINVFRHH